MLAMKPWGLYLTSKSAFLICKMGTSTFSWGSEEQTGRELCMTKRKGAINLAMKMTVLEGW